MTFDKKDSLAMRGMAIVFLMFHHCFRSEEVFGKFTVSFYPFPEDMMVEISSFLKICVGMFVFLSGYGLSLSLNKYKNQGNITAKQYSHFLTNKLLGLMWGFWFIFIIGSVMNLFITPHEADVYFKEGICQGIYNIFIDFFGLSTLFGTPQLIGTWWYMSLAISMIVLVPLMTSIQKKCNGLTLILAYIFVTRLVNFAVGFEIGEDSNCLRWVFAGLLGVLCAQYNILARLKAFTITGNKVVSKIIKFIVLTAVLIVLFVVRKKIGPGYSNYCFEFRDAFVPAFMIYYCYEFVVGIPGIRQVLILLGKHSLNIFLFHTFLRVKWTPDFIYSFEHFLLIPAVLLGISLVISILIELVKKYTGYNKLLAYILNKINTKYYQGI